MTNSAPTATTAVSKLGFKTNDIVQEFGYDDDVDFDFRDVLEDTIGSELLYDDDQEVVDSSILWWRENDGDLTDNIVDIMPTLSEGGRIIVLTQKPGREEYVDPADIQEAAQTTGMNASAGINIGPDWVATGLVARKKR
ncbi:MAG: DUF3052 domain-containing protein [Micrococcaceae bacterium]